MHTSQYSMSAYVVVHGECPLGFEDRDDAFEVTIGGKDQPLMLLFDHAALGRFLQLGSAALQQIKPVIAHEESTGA